ncbi:MAG TPA: hypothetical protein VD971_04870 [Phycisphaerales bacterium]|nr:hypothetical protein [Phycisphaerales bacterium]
MRSTVAACLSVLLLVGCSSTIPLTGHFGVLGGGKPELTSRFAGRTLELPARTRAYASPDAGVADLYFSDLPAETFRDGADLSTLTGTIVHIRMFMQPRAGKTPIADDATNATARVVVLAKGQAGVYAGGGFFRSGDRPGRGSYDGVFRAATLYLAGATPGFDDALGPSLMSGSIACLRDEKLAKAMARAFDTVAFAVDPVEDAQPEPTSEAPANPTPPQ